MDPIARAGFTAIRQRKWNANPQIQICSHLHPNKVPFPTRMRNSRVRELKMRNASDIVCNKAASKWISDTSTKMPNSIRLEARTFFTFATGRDYSLSDVTKRDLKANFPAVASIVSPMYSCDYSSAFSPEDTTKGSTMHRVILSRLLIVKCRSANTSRY